MTTAILTTSADTYLDLIRSFPLRPIRSRRAHKRALGILRELSNKRAPAVRDYKIVLASLVADYERSAGLRLDASTVSPAEIVRHLLDERTMSVNALAKTLNISQSSLNDMLNGRRDWSKLAIIRLSGHFGLQPGLFLQWAATPE